MRLGIVGLPNVGKSTLFNALTAAKAAATSYPFSTTESNVGVVLVPDNRLDFLQKLYDAKKITPATIEFVDIAGLVRGASSGSGLGNKFLSHIREVDAIVHVVRCFEDENILHVEGETNPMRDIDIIETELIFADLEVIAKRIERVTRAMKSDKSYKKELDLLNAFNEVLEANRPASTLEISKDDENLVKQFNLLTYKPQLFACNVSEDDLGGNSQTEQVAKYAKDQNAECFIVCAKMEEDLAQLDAEEKQEFLADLGIEQSGLAQIIQTGYYTLNLMSFLTAGPKEVRAWTVPIGIKAANAAGKIHSDIERGFIRAETVHFDDLLRIGSYNGCKDEGLVRLEGKEYC
jgi:GTP-binding protein YchF